jgi:hydroxymethylpyrimidine/phosphomethylpyrimidine kinase
VTHVLKRHIFGAEPCALTIAGLDPSGGAGIAADLRGFELAGVWGCAVCAVLTVQSTAGLRSIQAQDAAFVRAQADEVLANENILTLKTGALGSAENVRGIIDLLKAHPDLPAIVDPVMVATRVKGDAKLLDPDALEAMRELTHHALLVTPNVDEAEALLDTKIKSLDDLRLAAAMLVSRGARAALVKGGHLAGDHAIDVLATRNSVVLLRTPRRKGPAFHGGGCTLASLIAGHLAKRISQGEAIGEDELVESVRWSKRKLTVAISRPLRIGRGLLVLKP